LAVADPHGEKAARYVTVPVVDVRTALDTLAPGTIVEMDRTCATKMVDVQRALAGRFALAPLEPAAARFLRYRLDPRAGD
jgi:hypothetical protein